MNGWILSGLTLLSILPPPSDIRGDSIPVIRTLLEAGSLYGEIVGVASADAPTFRWLPSASFHFPAHPADSPDAMDELPTLHPFVRQFAGHPGDDRFPGLPQAAELSVWTLDGPDASMLLRLQVLEGALLTPPIVDGSPDWWLYLVEVDDELHPGVSVDSLRTLARRMVREPGSVMITPAESGRPSRIFSFPPAPGEMARRWEELVARGRDRFHAPDPYRNLDYDPPTPPYEEGASPRGWLEFTGPPAPGEEGKGQRLWIQTFWMNDAWADREVTAVTWVVDSAGRILFERTSRADESLAPPVLAQDMTGNGVDEVLLLMHTLVWDGEEFRVSRDPTLFGQR